MTKSNVFVSAVVACALLFATASEQKTQSQSFQQVPGMKEWASVHSPVPWPPDTVFIKRLDKNMYNILATWKRSGKQSQPRSFYLSLRLMEVGPPDTCPSECRYLQELALTGPPDTVMLETEHRPDTVLITGPPDTVALEAVNHGTIRLVAKWNAPMNPGRPLILRTRFKIAAMLGTEGCPPWCPPRLEMLFSRIAGTEKSKIPPKSK